jgi:methylase of polypeptide subunit release factors
VEEKGNKTPGYISYCAAKVLAEQEVWKFFKENEVAFDGAAINPPYVSESFPQASERPS